MLEALHCGDSPQGPDCEPIEPIIDESIDPDPVEGSFSRTRVHKYLEAIQALGDIPIPAAYSAGNTRLSLARAILDTLWFDGSFKLEDLGIEAEWKLGGDNVGDMAAFYASVSATTEMADALGVRLDGYDIRQSDALGAVFSASAGTGAQSRKRTCPETAGASATDWIIYMPFDTSEYRLGGSHLSRATGIPGGKAPEPVDTDYFMDCFEVVRELSEDGIIKAGATVAEGGLMAALARMFSGDCGITADLGGISKACGQTDMVKLLFAEIPGVLIQIEDRDYDYIDAELLLQDVAYYPIGHPRPGGKGVKAIISADSGVSGILQALLESTASEGED